MDQVASFSNENDDANVDSNNIIFTIKDTKFYVPVVTLSAKDNKKLSKSLNIGLEKSRYWNEYKTKSENINTISEYRYFLELKFAGFIRLLVLIYSIQDNDSKRYIAKIYYLPKDVIKNCIIIINGKSFYDQRIDSDIKRHK